jgi:hypothetical protein
VAQFRKKPVVIEAFELTECVGLANGAWPRWAHDAWVKHHSEPGSISPADAGEGVDIMTLEGVHHASPGDWIIKGVKGELYPCKPDIFAMTYDKAD